MQRISSVSAMGFALLSRTLCDLHGTCYVCTGGEGGEFETLIVYCHFFEKRIIVKKSRTEWDEITMSGQLILEEAALVGLHGPHS